MKKKNKKQTQRAVYDKVDERLLKRNLETFFSHAGVLSGELQLSWKPVRDDKGNENCFQHCSSMQVKCWKGLVI